jgi:hypothetical protein
LQGNRNPDARWWAGMMPPGLTLVKKPVPCASLLRLKGTMDGN